ncbi:MAG: hypothetical protein IJ739_04095 [Bacteroidaceae bacterium]|nr:hypothetical protein [Bacteroidaceae bacterium]
MATVCYINVYNSHVDRGATVTSVPIEHYEVDEGDIKVGEPLPKFKCSSPVVTAYDGQQLTLELRGKSFTIKVGEEVEIDSSESPVGMGVYSRKCYCVKLIGKGLIYKGGWQWGDTILQKLAGPIGDGEVWYPNGDHFKGAFHLSYASINGPAYAADGRYDFADGSWIERAWIHTSKDKEPQWWGLHGVFRIQRPKLHPDYPSFDTPDSIAMFLRGGKRYGFELFLADKPWVREWYAGDEVVRYSGPDELFQYEVVDSEIDETSKVDCTTLKLTLKDGDKVYHIEQQGGRYTANQYNSYVYEPSTHVTVELPNGDVLDHYGDDVRDFHPYDGYITVYCAKTGMSRNEHWKKGELVEAQEWKHDSRASVEVTLPDPTGLDGKLEAKVWEDGHIEYGYKEWVYDGEVKNNRPDGEGVLVGDRRHGERRYEGSFIDGVYVSDEEEYEGEITLHVRSGHKSWTVYSDGEWEYQEEDIVAKRGRLNLDGFWGYEITSIKRDCITIEYYENKYELRPDQPLHLYKEIEGREYSDGCVYDGDDYKLELTWKN